MDAFFLLVWTQISVLIIIWYPSPSEVSDRFISTTGNTGSKGGSSGDSTGGVTNIKVHFFFYVVCRILVF